MPRLQSVKIVLALAIVTMAVLTMGSSCQQNIVQKVVFKPAEDLMTMRVSLVFKDKVQSQMQGGFQTNYGNFFINPYAAGQPFEVGFDLNMNIFYDNHYVGLTPTTTLPNGLAIGIPYPVVEIKSPKPISSKFDLYGYVDISHQSWLGVSLMFGFMNESYFQDIQVQQVFLRDNEGKPGVLASVFGPVMNQDGTVLRNGGIGVFANVRQLIDQYHGKPVALRPMETVRIDGPNAHRMTSKQLKKLERSIINSLNAQ